MITREQIALIHVAKAQVGMSDDAYRALLQRVAGTDSSKRLDGRCFGAVMDEFARLGFTQRATPRKRGHTPRRSDEFASDAQLTKLSKLWAEFTGRDDPLALGRWLEKHLHVSHPRFLRTAQAGKAIGIVKRMVARKKAASPGSPNEVKRGRS